MDLLQLRITCALIFLAFGLSKAQYAYFPNDLDLLAKLHVEQERISYSEKAGDTSVFETNLYDIDANLIEYKSKDNMPIQARIVFHFDETNFCHRVYYYRNFILYQYKQIKKTGRKQVERFYSVSGKYKGLEQNIFYDENDREIKLIVKRKGHPKMIRKYTYHENGQIKSIWLKRDGKVNLSHFNEDGSRMGEELHVIPRKVIEYYDGNFAKIEQRLYKVSDILPQEIVKIGTRYQEEYEMQMYTHFLANGLNEYTEICIEDKLMYTYFFDYTFHEKAKIMGKKDRLAQADVSMK